MAEQRDRTRTTGTGSPTGAFPSVDARVGPHEPAMPRTLPEVPDMPAVTGVFPVVAEGEDAARQQDDSASATAPDAETPAKR